MSDSLGPSLQKWQLLHLQSLFYESLQGSNMIFYALASAGP